jgi:hypothetical protein
VAKFQTIDIVEVILSLSRRRNASHGCEATGKQGTSCSHIQGPLVYHIIRGNEEKIISIGDFFLMSSLNIAGYTSDKKNGKSDKHL